MNISRINSQLNTRQAYDIPLRRTQENFDTGSISGSPVHEQESQQSLKQQSRTVRNHEETFGAYDYSRLYNPDERFELRGRDSDNAALDAAGTLGSLQKNELLGQYRSFASEAGLNTAHDTVRGAENFSL